MLANLANLDSFRRISVQQMFSYYVLEDSNSEFGSTFKKVPSSFVIRKLRIKIGEQVYEVAFVLRLTSHYRVIVHAKCLFWYES